MSDNCVLLPILENRCTPCMSSVCANPAIEILRIENQVRMSSSMKTMMLTNNCVSSPCNNIKKKDPKHFSYERVYSNRRSRAMMSSSPK